MPSAGCWSGLDDEREHHVIVFMFDDVAVVDVGLGCGHAGWEVKLRPDRGEVAGIRLGRVLETALGRIRPRDGARTPSNQAASSRAAANPRGPIA